MNIKETLIQYREAKSISVNAEKKDMIRRVRALKDKGYSNAAIGDRLGMPESTVRNYLNPAVGKSGQ